ncbi:helix-turn-helix transcriptional regulator [Actinokineospora sp. UTMC 2448]|uniref:helix-turn-helix domain-containing protein n=1 Tax=Actinokineospora sp. UTMC 2448 TaxID=2268449 RepID=UPI002164D8D9|nr:helix-turn-helix transcriptional regulator [Actinokineospora sp. UTMC 2448]UVS79101.1 transcriptional regulator, y4mF family [Actinokineospora sp. UTMC 2448]
MDAKQAQWRQIGLALRHWRRRAGLTQAQLGDRLGYHHSQISKLENGSREPLVDVLRRADRVLGTGGELARMTTSLRLGQWVGGAGVLAANENAPASSVGAVSPADWPAKLPHRGYACPVHGYSGCALPAPADAADLQRVVFGADRDLPDVDAIHLLAAWYVALTGQCESGSPSAQRGVAEHVARRAAGWAARADERTAQVLLRTAAEYAHLAGRLRILAGQTGTGMAWLDQALRWAEVSGSRTVKVSVLCDMGLVARLEHDVDAASAYADALFGVSGGGRWPSVMAEVNRALGHGQRGDLAQCRHHIERARATIARFDLRDRVEAPWLTGDEGRMRIESALSSALRTVAAITGDTSTARQAIASTQDAIEHLPTRMRPTYLQFTVRLADSYACAGQLDAALATVDPIIPEIPSAPLITVRREFQDFHARLTRRWGGHRRVRDLDERLRT